MDGHGLLKEHKSKKSLPEGRLFFIQEDLNGI